MNIERSRLRQGTVQIQINFIFAGRPALVIGQLEVDGSGEGFLRDIQGLCLEFEVRLGIGSIDCGPSGFDGRSLRGIGNIRNGIENVRLGERAGRIAEAEAAGVKSVPALVLNDQVFHINFGASIDDLK